MDELALSMRWLKLTYTFAADAPELDTRPLVLPILLDTVYFEPFACLLASVPCGSRGLPVALTTYHRRELVACFPPGETWPDPYLLCQPAHPIPAASVPTPFLSQNRIEERLVDLVWQLLSPALRGVVVADRGFARASLFRWLSDRRRAFVIRIDAATHVWLPGESDSRPVEQALAVQPGERRWAPQAWYHQHERVPVALLALWEPGQEEPWYLATTLEGAAEAAVLYRWRMRCECTHRDAKHGVLLRCGGDAHRLTSVLHLHRLLLVLCLAEQLCALVGLQAWRELPEQVAPQPDDPSPLPAARAPLSATVATAPPTPAGDGVALAHRPVAVPMIPPATPRSIQRPCGPQPACEEPDRPLLLGPSMPPPIVAHRGPTPKPPPWLRRFVARGSLSYVRLGWEVLPQPDLLPIIQHLVNWLGDWLRSANPRWRPWQLRYRSRHWWPEARAA
ncbi:MAG: transposase [Candidatus Dormibacteraeota bacterium]|nr:transposase [Candidatus Dormibacteraeota bacterium]